MDWGYRIAAANDGGTPAIYWYLVHDGQLNGRAYGVGYHSKTKNDRRLLWSAGIRRLAAAADEWFEIRGN